MTQRDRIVLGVVIAALALGAFWMLGLKPKRQEASDLGAQVTQAQQRLNDARAQVDAGDSARAKYANNYATVARLGKAVPVDDDVPSLVYQLDATAKQTGVDFRTVKLSSNSAAATSPTSAAQGAAATQDQAQKNAASQTGNDAGANAQNNQNGSSGAANPAGSSATSPPPTAAPTQTATADLPPGASVGEAGLITMPFTFTFEGSFFKLSDFMTQLERYIKAKRSGSVDVRGRLLLINGFSLTAAPKGFPAMKASVAAQAYLLPVDQGLFDGASPTGPSAVTASQPAGDSGSGGSPVAPATVTP